MAEYTDGIERINIELSLRNKIRLADELEAFARAATCRWVARTTPGRFLRPNCWKTGSSRRWPWCARCAPVAGLAGRRLPLFAAAGPPPARQLEDADPRAPLAVDLRRQRLRAILAK